jgi:hypothetical protein
MGLTLHFSLALPATTPREEVTERLRQLHQFASRLPAETVGPMTMTSAGRSLGDGSESRDRLSQLFRLWAWLQLDPGTTAVDRDMLPDAVGFAVILGGHSEPAIFGLAWRPPRDEDWNPLPDEPWAWRWHCACKTQYASIEGDEHFVTCHTTLVSLLDEAARIGFDVEVTDEGGYWESRDVDRLLTEMRKMNRIVARFGGALHDAIGAEHFVEATIFEHPEFERLEMETDG